MISFLSFHFEHASKHKAATDNFVCAKLDIRKELVLSVAERGLNAPLEWQFAPGFAPREVIIVCCSQCRQLSAQIVTTGQTQQIMKMILMFDYA
jgi:hypothetical protein